FFGYLTKLGFGNSRNRSLQIQLYGCDVTIFKGHLSIGMEVGRFIPLFAEQEAKLHGKTTRMRSPDQFFGIGPHPVFETCLVRISRLIQYGTLCADGTATVFSGTLPMGTRLSGKFHNYGDYAVKFT